jgi:hypothetical protein
VADKIELGWTTAGGAVLLALLLLCARSFQPAAYTRLAEDWGDARLRPAANYSAT